VTTLGLQFNEVLSIGVKKWGPMMSTEREPITKVWVRAPGRVQG